MNITGGTFGRDTSSFTPSVKVGASVGEGSVNISGGSFDGGVLVIGSGYARISCGSFGRLGIGDPSGSDSYSILANVSLLSKSLALAS